MHITDGMLRRACDKQRNIFCEAWPNGAEITKANVDKAKELSLDLHWLSVRLLLKYPSTFVELFPLAGLQWLDLDGAPVTNAGLVHLKGLTRLRELYLNNTQVTDAGLAHLKGLTGLQYLFLNDTQVTDAGVAELKAALPGLRVYYKAARRGIGA